MFLISLLSILISRRSLATATEKQPADGRTAVKFSGIPRTYTPADMHRALKRMGAFKNGDVPLSNGKSGLLPSSESASSSSVLTVSTC